MKNIKKTFPESHGTDLAGTVYEYREDDQGNAKQRAYPIDGEPPTDADGNEVWDTNPDDDQPVPAPHPDTG